MGVYVQKFYDKFISLNGRPRHMAMGFALGILVGFFPIIGTHTVITLALASLFGVHLSSMFLGSWAAANPVTMVPLLYGEYMIGKWVLGHKELFIPDGKITFTYFFNASWEMISSLMVGYMALGVLFAIISYPLMLWFFRRNRIKAQQ